MATAATQTPAREQVFCHECRREWYRDEHGLVCPNELCRSDFVEIIESNNDPRQLPPPDDSDSEEDHDHPFLRAFGPFGLPQPSQGTTVRETPAGTAIRVQGPGYTFFSQTTYSGPRRPPLGSNEQRLGSEPRQPREEVIADLFSTMLQNIVGDHAYERSRREAGQRVGEDEGRPQSENGDNRPHFRTFHATFGAPGGLNPRNTDASQAGNTDVPDIHAFLRSLFGPPSEGDDRIPPALARLFGAPGAGGDYVSQAELDRIVSQLMEQHQGNAPPPAAKEDIEALPRTKVTQEMVNDGIDCAVCKEDLVLDEEVANLPCKHSYHFDCVSKWLEAHNTCPICRHPLTPEDQQQRQRRQSSSSNNQPQPSGMAAAIPFLGLFGPSWTHLSGSQNNSQNNNPQENNSPSINNQPSENNNQSSNNSNTSHENQEQRDSNAHNNSSNNQEQNSGSNSTSRNVHSAFASLFRRRGS